MKVLIIEDETLAAKRLQQLLKEIDPEIETFGPIDTVVDAVEHLKSNSNYDVLFLDIQLADGKSFTIFERVQVSIPVIFVTAYNEFAIKAFDLNSIDYLLKPVYLEKLKESLQKLAKIKEYYQKNTINDDISLLMSVLRKSPEKQIKSRFLVNKADTLLPINTSEIAWFVAEDKLVFLMTTAATRYAINYSLDELEEKLDSAQFFRINRQYICNIDSIAKIYSFFNYRLKIELKPKPLEEIFVSKSRASEFKIWLGDY